LGFGFCFLLQYTMGIFFFLKYIDSDCYRPLLWIILRVLSDHLVVRRSISLITRFGRSSTHIAAPKEREKRGGKKEKNVYKAKDDAGTWKGINGGRDTNTKRELLQEIFSFCCYTKFFFFPEEDWGLYKYNNESRVTYYYYLVSFSNKQIHLLFV
jgi:hypothetical protein